MTKPKIIIFLKAPPNLLSDHYDPVYEEGPLLCRKVRAHSVKQIGDKEQPIHIKPIGCCPNNEDGKVKSHFINKKQKLKLKLPHFPRLSHTYGINIPDVGRDL